MISPCVTARLWVWPLTAIRVDPCTIPLEFLETCILWPSLMHHILKKTVQYTGYNLINEPRTKIVPTFGPTTACATLHSHISRPKAAYGFIMVLEGDAYRYMYD